MIYFTSDTHFLHDNIVRFSSRPFLDASDMETALIETWNSLVLAGDTVYHLGDFAISYGPKHADRIDNILSRLNGQKFLIKGNHDRKEVTQNPRWVKVMDYHEIKVDRGGIHKQRIVMFHYPIRSWNQYHRNAWHLHGHCHGNLPDPGGKIMDVGVDVHGYRPVSIDEVAEFMADREPILYDHHGDRNDILESEKALADPERTTLEDVKRELDL